MKFEKYKLGNIIECYDKQRKPLSIMERNNFKGSYPYYGAQEIIDFVQQYIFDGRYILLAEDGENLRSKIKPIANIVEGKFWLNNHAHIFKTKVEFDLEYLCYYLNHIDISGYITGTTQPKLNQANMNCIELELPSLENQSKIGKVLKIINAKIEENNATNNNLYDIGLSLLNNYFYGIDAKVLLNEVITFVKGKKPKNISTLKEETYLKYLTIAGLNGQESNYADTEKMLIANQDLLMVMDGASSGDIYYSDYGVVGSTLSRIDIIDKKYIKEYIFFCLKKYNNLIKSKNTGSAIPHTDKVFVGSLEIPKLDKDKQMQFKVLLEKVQENLKENENLTKLRNTLLPKLMNGEIDLENIEI